MPPPPPLPAGDADAQALFLVRTFAAARGVIWPKYGRVFPVIPRARGPIDSAARVLAAADLAPGAWVAHALAVWRNPRVRDPRRAGWAAVHPPLLAWVYAAAHLRDWLPEARAHAARTAGATVTHATQRALLGRWRAAREALAALPVGAPEDAARAAVSAHLAGWDVAVAGARTAVAAYERTVVALAASGRWVWG